MAIDVGIVVLDGVTDSGLAVALDVLRAANVLAQRRGGPAPFALRVLSASGRQPRTAAGLRLSGAATLRGLARCQVVLVPGCWLEDEGDLRRWLARPDVRRSIEGLGEAAARGALLGVSCTATFLLAATGLLSERQATTTWWLASPFRARFPRVQLDVTQSLTTDGKLLCAGSVFAMADLALAIVSRFAGPSLARQCMRVLLLDEHPSQAPYMVLNQVVTNEPLVRQAEQWVRRHLGAPFSIAQLAKALGVSQRTLARRLTAALGGGPLALVQRVRLEVATHLLETSSASVEEVALRVGYEDAGTLRRLIQRLAGHSPKDLRRRRSPARVERGARASRRLSPPR